MNNTLCEVISDLKEAMRRRYRASGSRTNEDLVRLS